ncbi:MAG: hypothetical protein QGD90_13045, partial [Candidatus Hydrogenedentes bacterium]|nr:hypothetical protein [Candidatus Hydrogenedentota bacterium]
VTREDVFPPAGTWINVTPQSSQGAVMTGDAIPGRIVHTRVSPEVRLRFAGLEFVEELNEDAARSLGLHSPEDNVIDALKTLQELEDSFRAGMQVPSKTVEREITRPVVQMPRLDMPEADLGTPAADLSVEAERLRLEMESACKSFLNAAGPFVREWAQDKIADTITRRHALSRAKGVEGLRPLKAELRLLLQDYPALINAQLNRDELWAHRGELDGGANGTKTYYDVKNEKPALWLVDEFRRLMGFAGVLLIKHGFDELSKKSDWAPLSHEQAVVAYRGRFAFSGDMTAALKRASALFDAMCVNEKMLREEKEAQARDGARRLWEEA